MCFGLGFGLLWVCFVLALGWLWVCFGLALGWVWLVLVLDSPSLLVHGSEGALLALLLPLLELLDLLRLLIAPRCWEQQRQTGKASLSKMLGLGDQIPAARSTQRRLAGRCSSYNTERRPRATAQ